MAHYDPLQPVATGDKRTEADNHHRQLFSCDQLRSGWATAPQVKQERDLRFALEDEAANLTRGVVETEPV